MLLHEGMPDEREYGSLICLERPVGERLVWGRTYIFTGDSTWTM